jgi:SAM-dependent methyltransferase
MDRIVAPDSKPDALAQEAERLLSIGRVDDAARVCHRLLAAEPDNPTALMILGTVYLAAERWADAERFFMRGCAACPHVVGFHAALGRVRLQMNQPGRALEPLENCVLLDPGTHDHRASLVAVYQMLAFATFSEASKLAMLACLADDGLTHSLMHKAWLSLLRVDPEATQVLACFDGAADYASFRTAVAAAPALLRSLETCQLLRRGLLRFLAADVAIERGLTFMRRFFFDNRDALDDFLPTLCLLARYCFLTEYVFDSEEDHAPLRDPGTPGAVALLGCYEPLWSHAGATKMAHLSDEPCYRELARALIEEPLEERALLPSIPTMSPIDDAVSRAVQRQYEESPYPRWVTVGSGSAHARGARGRGRRILVAGCGTGSDAADAALSFPGAIVEAVDLSRVSLAYGARKAREAGLGNLSFAHGDLLAISGIGKEYNLILSAGVLHHMADPIAGLRALLSVLHSGGVLRVSLYSRIARTAVAEARAWIASAGFAPTPVGIRAFRRAVIARAAGDPMRAWLTRSYDFYSLSQCRDLVFHVQEHTFTLPQIAQMARDLELSVIHLDVPSPAALGAYRERFPHDPEAAQLANWHELEQRQPSMFSGMYSLWLCRARDRAIVDLDWLHDEGDEVNPG